MTERKTLKLPADDFERHNERRKDLGLSWAEYVDGQAPDAPEITADVSEVTLEASERTKLVRAIADELAGSQR